MKKLTYIAIAVSFISVSAFAAQKQTSQEPVKQAAKTSYSRNYGMAGCGLGSMVVGKRGGQIFAATTNGTFYNQTFAITMGTSNCPADDPNADTAARVDGFVIANKVALANDIARGDGETVDNIASLMGCEQNANFGLTLQQNFPVIFPDHSIAPNEVTDAIITVIRQDKTLLNTCKHIS